MLCLWWFCANLQVVDQLNSGRSSDMWVASCPSRLSLYWQLGLVVDHRSLSIIPTERQVQQFTKHVRASPGWHFEQSHSASLKNIRLTSLVGWLLEPTCNLKISWKLRRLALLVLASNAIPGDTIRIPLHCTASPLPTVTTTQQWCTGSSEKVSGSGSVNASFCTRIKLHCAMFSCAEEECAQWSPCLDHIFLIETSINLTNVKAWFSTKLSTGEYLQILQNQYESKPSPV